jgi:hypothetical protein
MEPAVLQTGTSVIRFRAVAWVFPRHSTAWFIGPGRGWSVAKAVPAEAGSQFRGEPDMTGVEVLGQGG